MRIRTPLQAPFTEWVTFVAFLNATPAIGTELMDGNLVYNCSIYEARCPIATKTKTKIFIIKYGVEVSFRLDENRLTNCLKHCSVHDLCYY